MTSSINIACGFLGGTIVSVDGGYRVLQHPRPDRVFSRIADARWFLAITWCDRLSIPAGILNHDGQLSFQNQAAVTVGEATFLPPAHRRAIFHACLALSSGETTRYTIRQDDSDESHQVEILSLDIDPRYGRVAAVWAVAM